MTIAILPSPISMVIYMWITYLKHLSINKKMTESQANDHHKLSVQQLHQHRLYIG